MQQAIPVQESALRPTTKSTPTRPPSEARVLGGRYRVRRLIGRGESTDVYLGDDLLLERVVTIKILQRSIAEDVTRLDRFRREAMTLAAVRSPHLVGVYDLGVTSEEVYLVVQHMEGRTIEEEVARLGPIGQVRAEMVLAQLLAGLAAMHDRGLPHRDIRSSNVLLDQNDEVVLLDLGIVLETRRALPTVVGQGTPTEVARERPTTDEIASDIYQVGLLMLFLLTGVDSARRSQRIGFEDLFQRLPLPLASVARRALDTDPAERFRSATMMKNALETALEISSACEPSRAANELLEANIARTCAARAPRSRPR